MARKIKTNVVKRMWSVPVVRKKDGAAILYEVMAESYEAAKLLIPDTYRFDEDSIAHSRKVSEN